MHCEEAYMKGYTWKHQWRRTKTRPTPALSLHQLSHHEEGLPKPCRPPLTANGQPKHDWAQPPPWSRVKMPQQSPSQTANTQNCAQISGSCFKPLSILTPSGIAINTWYTWKHKANMSLLDSKGFCDFSARLEVCTMTVVSKTYVLWSLALASPLTALHHPPDSNHQASVCFHKSSKAPSASELVHGSSLPWEFSSAD